MEHKQKRTKILLADENLLFRQGLKTVFEGVPDFQIVAEASLAAEAIVKCQLQQPDIAILDLNLTKGRSLEVARQIRSSSSGTEILFLVPNDGRELLQSTMEAGVAGCLIRSSTPAQFVAAVKEVIRGGGEMSPQALGRLVADLHSLARSGEQYSRTPALTARETEILKLLAEGNTVKEVAAELGLSAKTVEAHKFNLMRKLDIHNRAELIDYAIEQKMVPAPAVA